MAQSVTELQQRIASIADQSTTAPDDTSDDWNLRLKYLNMSQREWAEAYTWRTLYKEHNALTTQSTSNTTISLPSDFRRLASFPRIASPAGTTDDFSEIRPEEQDQRASSDKYVYILGSESDGYKMVIKNADSGLVSGASIFTPYYASPASLASPANVSMIPDPTYLVNRTVAYLWEAREDARFPGMKAEADKILARMIETENVHSEAAVDGEVRTVEKTRFNFKWGRN